MSDFTRLFEQMIAQTTEMAKAVNPMMGQASMQGFEKMWPTLPKDFMEMMWGNAFNPAGLDAKTRLLAMIGGMTVIGSPVEAAFRTTVRHAIEAGAKEQEIAEVIYQMSMLGGVPAMTRALELAQGVFTENKEEPK